MPLSRSRLARVGVFVVAVILTVAVVTASTVAPVLDPGEGTGPDRPAYEPSRLVPDRVPSDGQISTDRGPATGVVLIDQAHRNRVGQDDLHPLETAITQHGYAVEYLESAENLDKKLGRADAFVAIDPGVAYTDTEADRIEGFVESGGRLVLVGEPSQMGIQRAGLFAIIVPLPKRMGPLATRFGIQFSEGHLFNMETNDGNHLNILAAGTDAPLADGVEQTAMFTAADVEARNGDPVLVASEGTRNARGDAEGEYAVAVRSDNVLAVGDRTFLQRGNFRVADNDLFLSNVVEFMTTGDRERDLLDYPGIVGPDPTITYTSADLLDASQTIGGDLRADRPGGPSLELETGPLNTQGTDVLVTTFSYLDTHPGSGAGVEVSGGTVAVPGYESDEANVSIIHLAEDGTVVVAADTTDGAENAARLLVNRQIEPNAISNRTVVIRSSSP